MRLCKHGTDSEQFHCGQCWTEAQQTQSGGNGASLASEMTLREHFAALAMQGVLGNAALNTLPTVSGEDAMLTIAKAAVRGADILLAELAKVQP